MGSHSVTVAEGCLEHNPHDPSVTGSCPEGNESALNPNSHDRERPECRFAQPYALTILVAWIADAIRSQITANA